MTLADLRVTVKRDDAAANRLWRGVLKDGKRAVWSCTCKVAHFYREDGPASATACAASELKRRAREARKV